MNFWPELFRLVSKQSLRRLAVAFVVLIAPVFFFVELADEVKDQETLLVDEAVLRGVNSLASPQLDTVAVILTQLGGVVGVVALTVGFALLLWGRQLRRMAVLLVAGVGGAVTLNLLLKLFFQRDRPQLWERLVTENSYSFPSGHAMASSALAFSLVIVFWPTRWRWLALFGAGFYMIVIGLTRLYLGVHYPSDVLAGWMVSLVWVAITVYILTYHRALRWFLVKR